MAITNPKLFGLNVLTYLADVENRNAALRSLDLNILDLESFELNESENINSCNIFNLLPSTIFMILLFFLNDKHL